MRSATASMARVVLHEGQVIRFIPLERSLRAREGEPRAKARSAVVVRAGKDSASRRSASTAWSARGIVVLRPLSDSLAAATVWWRARRSTREASRSSSSTPSALRRRGASGGAVRRRRSSRAARAGARRRRLADDAHAGAEHPRVGRLRGRASPCSGEEALEKRAASATACSSSTSRCPASTASSSRAAARRPAPPRHPRDPRDVAQPAGRPPPRQRSGRAGFIVKGEFDQADLLRRSRRLVGRRWPSCACSSSKIR